MTQPRPDAPGRVLGAGCGMLESLAARALLLW